ncbi:hypothetical protein [Prevotella sp. KH2C16]|uniref:hypothetical protein n=1 Tax=Prevotella sp. KH2C16 TaxID=1855325 RepID=UPI0008EC504B|nr:hypothetical protein [Prevotella sp. KH2C16]SFG12234.1 hypothetical protein SAMN05216383_105147 [Prevotella sp. KH2C16]
MGKWPDLAFSLAKRKFNVGDCARQGMRMAAPRNRRDCPTKSPKSPDKIADFVKKKAVFWLKKRRMQSEDMRFPLLSISKNTETKDAAGYIILLKSS